MPRDSFATAAGGTVAAVTADEMRNIDDVAVEEVGLRLLQMMENAGRNLAAHARALGEGDRDGADGRVVVLAGGGGNGGGGLCAARHLRNRGVPVDVVPDRDPDELSGAAATQATVLREMGLDLETDPSPSVETRVADAGLAVDALVGYSLRGEPRGRTAELIRATGETDAPVLSLDVPSGYDATTGERPGVAVAPDRTLTLALPKTGLDAAPGELYLADIGIPATVYERAGIEYDTPFEDADWVELAE